MPYFCMLYISQDFLKTGYVVQLVTKLSGKSLRVLENGVLDCGGHTGTACESCNRLISEHQPVVISYPTDRCKHVFLFSVASTCDAL